MTVYTTNRRWYEADVEAPARKLLKEWTAELDAVLDAYFEDGQTDQDDQNGQADQDGESSVESEDAAKDEADAKRDTDAKDDADAETASSETAR
ncbi:hypothetical protein NKH77_27720 [Streptomyces sp. M19]